MMGRVTLIPASLKLVFLFDVSYYHGQLLFMHVDSGYSISHSFLLAGTESVPVAYIKQGRGLSPFPQGEQRRPTAWRNPASFAVALYCGIGSSSLNALVNAFDKLHMVRGWNSSCTGLKVQLVYSSR
jgi:cyanate permease